MLRTLIFFLLLLSPVLASAYHATRSEMIQRAQLIAVVDIEPPVACRVQGKHWNYSQQAEARLVQSIKGGAPEKLTLYGGEDFECAQVNLKAGRFLVFLVAQGDGYSGCNWNASCLSIDASNRVAWMSQSGRREIDCKQPLDQVTERIRKTL